MSKRLIGERKFALKCAMGLRMKFGQEKSWRIYTRRPYRISFVVGQELAKDERPLSNSSELGPDEDEADPEIEASEAASHLE